MGGSSIRFGEKGIVSLGQTGLDCGISLDGQAMHPVKKCFGSMLLLDALILFCPLFEMRRKTMKGPFHNLASALALCGMVVVLVHPHLLRSEWVLCIGQDGHLEIEIAEAGRCVDCLDDAHPSTASVVSGQPFADHCGNCDDIRLASGGFQARQHGEASKNLKPGFTPSAKLPLPKDCSGQPFPVITRLELFETSNRSFLGTVRLII